MTIDPNKYYKVSEIISEHPLLSKRGKFWLMQQVRENRLKAVCTTVPPKMPRYLLLGSDVIDYINRLTA